jgi:energy-coupling factor transport system permease protein
VTVHSHPEAAGPAPDAAPQGPDPASRLPRAAPEAASDQAPDEALDGAAPAGLSARAWLIWSLSAVTVALVGNDPFYRGLVALAALDVLATWIPRGRRLKPLGLAALFAAGFAALINLLASHTGADVIVSLPDGLPLVGGPLTVESLAFGGALGLGLVAAVLAVAPLSMVLAPHDVVDAMPTPLERTGIAVASSMNLVAGLGRTFTAVRDAQRMRGWKPRGLRSWNEVFVPVLLTAIEDSVLLAEAMEARGFGASRRSSFAEPRMTRRDLLVIATALAAVAAFVVARLTGAQLDWYPYPTLALPPIDPPIVAACLLLVTPALVRRRSDA